MGTKITIITVCFNALEDLKKTVKSVAEQNYENIEYLIVDGDSSDGTKAYLEVQQESFAQSVISFRYVSEPDAGIYDAMNKGTRLATGDFLLFLNAGDCLVEKNTLKNIFGEKDYSKITVVYGNHYSCNGENSRPITAGEPSGLRKTMIFSHQAAFIRRVDQLETPYNPVFNICADYDFFLGVYLAGKRFKHIPEFVSTFQEGGLCQQNINKTTKQVFDVRRAHGLINKKNYLFYVLKRWQYVVRKLIISFYKSNICRNIMRNQDDLFQ